jgi:hypothetical protein
MRAFLLFGVMVLVGGAAVSADQLTVDPAANAKLGALRQAPQANPYGRLFDVREALKPATNNAAPAPKRKIVCGMTVIEVGPALDPKMALEPRKDPGLTYTIRAIDPPVCNASAAK